MSVRFERYVAIGDSTTEGLDDPDGCGGYHGWANRFAEHLAAAQGSVLYANLAVRGLRTRRIRETQLDRALAMRPDVATVVSGTNDLMTWRFDPDAVIADAEAIQRALIASGCRVLTFTLPDLSRLMPRPFRPLGRRIVRLNDSLRAAAARTGATLVDTAAFEAALDTRFWSDDRLHANALGHARIAAALADAIGLSGFADWRAPLPSPPPHRFGYAIRAELAWTRRHLLPWIARHSRGRSSGDGRACKRPELALLRAGE